MLRSIFAIVMVVSLALGFVLPTVAQADKWYDPIDYRDLDYKVTYGTEFNTVVVPLPTSHFYLDISNKATPGELLGRSIGTGQLTFDFVKGQNYIVGAFPAGAYGFSLDGMPVGTQLHFDLLMTVHSPTEILLTAPDLYAKSYYRTNNGFKNIQSTLIKEDYLWGSPVHMDFVIQGCSGATSYVPLARFDALSGYDWAELTVVMSNVYLEMEVSVDYWTQWQNEQNGKLLGDIKDELKDVNDNLGDLNDKVDKLPEDIGNEMQGVIDKENDKAESSGNKFVNQILDKLPDPSTEVLGSLKGLTDSMAYTGTDCKLKIPALVIPEIDGLIPETEIWGGTEFSFNDYLSFLPPALLTVVQSLFTIAIVLYCVYELKGIISYCLTLNDKKGG